MPSKYLLSAYAVLGVVLSTLLTYSILTIILIGRDYIISAAYYRGNSDTERSSNLLQVGGCRKKAMEQ